jgi:hypothetical protein
MAPATDPWPMAGSPMTALPLVIRIAGVCGLQPCGNATFREDQDVKNNGSAVSTNTTRRSDRRNPRLTTESAARCRALVLAVLCRHDGSCRGSPMDNYSRTGEVVSKLFAIGSPARPVLNPAEAVRPV